jgi:hypothetical protein
LLIFGAIYFGAVLPTFQLFSAKFLGRRFIVRLGNPWQFSNVDHRWDVLLSVLSFMLALALTLMAFDFFFPLADVNS